MAKRKKLRLGVGAIESPLATSRSAARRIFIDTLFRLHPDALAELANLARGLSFKDGIGSSAVVLWGQRRNLSDRWVLDDAWYQAHLRKAGCQLDIATAKSVLPVLRAPVGAAWPEADPYAETLEEFLETVEVVARQRFAATLATVPDKRVTTKPLEHFEWLVRWQVDGLTPHRIRVKSNSGKQADERHIDTKTVRSAVDSLSKLLGLTRRARNPASA